MLPISRFDTEVDQMVAHTCELAKLESPSNNKAAADACAERLVADLKTLNPARVEVDPQPDRGGNVIAYWPDSAGNETGGIVLMCHYDTVHPVGMLDTNPLRVEGDKLYGPGVWDMKASIVQVMTALRVLQAEGQWPDVPITFLITSDEEINSAGSLHLIEGLGKTAGLVLCMEPALDNGDVKVWRKGVGQFTITTRGVATHSGSHHHLGVNALAEMAHHITFIESLTDYDKGTSLSVNMISAGTAVNTMPDECTVQVDLRVMDANEGKRVVELIHGLQPKLAGASIEVEGDVQRPPMPYTEPIAKAYAHVRAVSEQLGDPVGKGGTGGGSDANFVAPLGTPVICGLGPLGAGAHTPTEYVTVSTLARKTALLAGIMSEWTPASFA